MGLCPKPHSHLRGRRGRWQTLSTYPYGECWVDSRRQGVKCTTSSPLTPLHLRGGSKTNRSGRAGNLSRLAKQPRSVAGSGWVGGDKLCGKGAGGFSLHPCHVANAGVGSAHGCWQDPWGSRSRKMCPVGTHLRVLGLQGTEPALCSLAWLSGDRWAHVGSVAKAAPCALRPLIT